MSNVDLDAKSHGWYQRVECPACGTENWGRVTALHFGLPDEQPGDIAHSREIIWCSGCRRELTTRVPGEKGASE